MLVSKVLKGVVSEEVAVLERVQHNIAIVAFMLSHVAMAICKLETKIANVL